VVPFIFVSTVGTMTVPGDERQPEEFNNL